eukprot:scaffold22582_cov17-Tisochrysis_lutea.AAC.2
MPSPAAHSCRLKPPWKPRPCRGLAGPQCPGSALAAAASEPAHWAASPPLLHPRCPQHCCCCRCCCCYWPSLGRCGVAAGAAGLLDCYCLVAVGGGAAVHFPTGHRLAGSGRGLPSACLGCPPEGMCTAPGPYKEETMHTCVMHGRRSPGGNSESNLTHAFTERRQPC